MRADGGRQREQRHNTRITRADNDPPLPSARLPVYPPIHNQGNYSADQGPSNGNTQSAYSSNRGGGAYSTNQGAYPPTQQGNVNATPPNHRHSNQQKGPLAQFLPLNHLNQGDKFNQQQNDAFVSLQAPHLSPRNHQGSSYNVNPVPPSRLNSPRFLTTGVPTVTTTMYRQGDVMYTPRGTVQGVSFLCFVYVCMYVCMVADAGW